MFDKYLIKLITSYLKLCTNCNKYDIINYDRMCIVCKKYFCNHNNNCESNLIRNGNHFETTSNYCISCHQKYFNY